MAWYKTGTVAVTNASTTVTGTGTNFVSGAQVGDGFLGPNELLYEITAINSATSLTIAPAYGGATASSQSYAIAPTQGLVASLASDVTDLITDYQSVVDNAGAGKFGDGSAASPAIRFTNDQDTGFFRDTANEIAFATAGVKRGEFTSSGIQMLDGQKFIAGTGNDLSIFHNGSTSLIEDNGTGGITLRSDIFTVQNAAGNETVAQFVQDGFVKLFHNNSQVFTTISSGASITGSLGIGTSGPTMKLDVNGDNLGTTSGDRLDMLRLSTLSSNDDNLDFTIERLSNGTTWTSAAHRIQRKVDTTKMGYIQFGSNVNDLITFGEGTTERVRIDGDGNVGIGTSSPVYPLVVQAANPRLQLLGTGTNTGLSGLLFGDADTATRGQINYNHTSDSLDVVVNGAEAMRITSSGSVGIGTSSPDQKIHVSGAGSQSIRIENTNTNLIAGSVVGSVEFEGNDLGASGVTAAVKAVADSATGKAALVFDTGTAGSASERMRITSEGRIGAGTAAPAYQLHLNKGTDDDGLFIGSTSNTENKRIVFGTAASIGKAAIATLNEKTFGRKSLNFYTNSVGDNGTDINYATPRMVITNDGDVVIGDTNSTQVGYVHKTYINNTATGTSGAVLGLRYGSTATRRQINFMNPNGIVGRIQTSGSATSYVTSSDYRLKENIVDISDGIERVKQLKPKRFNFIADPNLTVDGFVAHETQTVVPEAIDGVKDETQAIGNLLDANGTVVEQNIPQPEEMPEGNTWTETGSEPAYQGIDQSKIVPVLTAALKEAIAKIEALETRLTALEG